MVTPMAVMLFTTLSRARLGLALLVVTFSLALTLSGCGKREAKAPAMITIPFELTERNGAAALQFTNWTIVFEAIPARVAGIGSTGLIAVAGAAPQGEYKFRGLQLRQFAGKEANIVSVNNYTFKLISSGRRVVFNDHAYDLKEKPREILVSKEGKTREKSD